MGDNAPLAGVHAEQVRRGISAVANSPSPAPSKAASMPEIPRFARNDRRAAIAIIRLAVVIALLLLWEGGYRSGAIDPFFFSAPSLIGAVLYEQFSSGTIWKHLAATIEESLAGLALGFVAGAMLGWLAAQRGLAGQIVEPGMMLLNAVPRIVLAPMFIMWFGIGMGSKIALSFILVFVVIFFAVYSGLREVDRSLVERIVVLGGTRRDLLREVYVPSVLAWIFASLRVTVGFAFTGAVVGELIASSRGLGYLLSFAENSSNASLMMATVALVMAMIALVFVGVVRIERRAMIWKQQSDQSLTIK